MSTDMEEGAGANNEKLANNGPKTAQTARRNNFRTQWLILTLALTILAGVMVHQRVTNHGNITAQEHYRLQTQAQVIAANVEQQLGAASLALDSVIKDLPYLREHEDLKLTDRRLQALTDAMPGIRTMMILDANGLAVASNRDELIGMDFHSRDYFAVPAQDQNPATLYLSPPFKSVLGNYLFNLSRVIPSSTAGFDGIVSASIDPEYFQVLLSSVLYAPDMTSSIIHGDGIRFLQVPQQSGESDENPAPADSGYTRHQKSGRPDNVFILPPQGSDSERIVALHTVRARKPFMDKPLYVTCSRNRSAVYEHWRDNTLKEALYFILISTAAGAGLALLQRRQRGLSLLADHAQEMINLRLKLMEYAVTHDMQSLLKRALDEVCRLSNSLIGFYHFVDSDQQTISLQAWSTRTLDEFCTTEGYGLHYPIVEAGVWADCIRRRRPIIHNDYASLPNRNGLPEGHASVIRELVVPIFRTGQVTAILGVGNKPIDYTDQDIELVSYLADVVWEITERKRHEEERHKQGLRYQTLQAISRDGIHILDQRGNLTESNAAFRQMLGYPAEEDLRLNVTEWDAAIPPEELPARIQEMIQNPTLFETKHRRRDGTVFDAEVNVCGVQLDDSWYLYASARDISKRKEMEASLRESRQRQADIFDFLPDATFVVDRDMKVIAWNRAMEEMSGVSKEEMLGQGDHAYTIPFYGERRNQLLDLIDVDDEELKAKYQGVTRQGERLYAETFCPALHNGKGAHVWAVGAPLCAEDGRRIGAIESIRDITAIKETEAGLASSNRDLEQFAYVASHDLQEPLRKISGFTELLANRYKGTLDEKAESYMDYIIDGATRMRTLINDLLSYSRVMRSNRVFAEVDCSAVVSQVLRDMEPAIKESNAEISCGPLPIISADPTQLGQLFQNLIGNAIKYRGPVPPKIVINAIRQPNDWLFSVADNGIGIAPEFFDRIFVLFQRLHTRSEYPGTGIGLAVSRKIVERHGGNLWVESTGDAGSTFFFTIPSTPKRPELIS